MTTVMVTGATGFIGQWLCAELTAAGHEVHALIRRPEQLELLRQECERRGGLRARLHGLVGDLDLPGLGAAELPEVELVYHLGARFAWGLGVAEARETNVGGSLRVADLAGRLGARLVLVGGFMSQNPTYLAELRVDPTDPTRTDWGRTYARVGAYEASKLESFFAAARRAADLGVEWLGVHPAGLCGHSRTGEIAAGQPFAELVDGIRTRRMAVVPGGPSHWLPLVTVDHLAALLAALAQHPWPPQQELVVLDPDTPDLASTVALVAEQLAVPVPRRRVPVGVLRALLGLPGAQRLTGSSPESLGFLRTERLDATAAADFAASAGVSLPSIRDAITRTAAALA
ncbi:NAD-dependent epimerase/dehydratase family protein [Intrasporangium sp. DVR]|uniref:NAD-dependent epimerase/dehydratase family protein n=1 Tax=Intrasporangium sp. DVR TaxID=3127867 RepID=UPI00313A6BCF